MKQEKTMKQKKTMSNTTRAWYVGLILTIWFAMIPSYIVAQEGNINFSSQRSSQGNAEEEDNTVLELELALVSNYVFRGFDIHELIYARSDKDPSAFNNAWSIQPSVTYYTPLKGLYFNIWMSYALHDRSLAGEPLLQGTGIDGGDIPLLSQNDEIDYTIAYEGESKIGTVGFGFLIYTYVGLDGGSADPEIFFSWSPPGPDWVSAFYFTTAASFGRAPDLAADDVTGAIGLASQEYTYFQLGYSYGYSFLNDNIEVYGDLGVGFKVDHSSQDEGVNDITLGIGSTVYGVDFSFNLSYRPDQELIGQGYEEDIPVIMWVSLGYSYAF